MGTTGSILGAILMSAGVFLSIWITWSVTDGMIGLLLFLLFGLLGGWALGALNSRKAKTQEKYKNEYIFYAFMMFAAIIFLGLFYLISGMDRVAAKNPSEIADTLVVVLAMLSGILTWIGLGLAVANMLVENTGY